MSRQVTIILDDDLDKKMRLIQAKRIQTENDFAKKRPTDAFRPYASSDSHLDPLVLKIRYTCQQ